jgi:hypothetical protein
MNLLVRLSDPEFYRATSYRVQCINPFELLIIRPDMLLRFKRGLSPQWTPQIAISAKLPDQEEAQITRTELTGDNLQRWMAIWSFLIDDAYQCHERSRDDNMTKILAQIEGKS